MSCPQERVMDIIAIVAESRKGHNFAIPRSDPKMGSLILYTDAIY